jgi:aspartate aminotransferase
MTLIAPSANIATLRESATIAVSARAKALRASGLPIIDLGAGEPDFPTPQFVVDEAHRALDAGATRYTQVEGILPLREAIAARANTLRGSDEIGANNVVVTTGTKQGLFNACFALFGVGDEVLVPTPGWPSYYEMIGLARATPVAVRGSRENDLKVTADDLRRAATDRTRGVVINSPCNPTGAVYSHPELTDIATLAAERGWWLVSDEIYREISYNGDATSMLAVAPDLERLVVVDGVAKSFAMTGWRIGWSIAPASLTRSMTALQSQTTSNAATLSQHAALAALSGDTARSTIDAMVGEFKQRRDTALSMLRGAGFDVIEPTGAFYLFVRVGAASHEDPEPGSTFAERLLKEAHVAVVPGVAFRTPEWIRMSYAAPAEQVVEGVSRVVEGGRAASDGRRQSEGRSSGTM